MKKWVVNESKLADNTQLALLKSGELTNVCVTTGPGGMPNDIRAAPKLGGLWATKPITMNTTARLSLQVARRSAVSFHDRMNLPQSYVGKDAVALNN